ncbi:MAG: hypothetical protein L0229_30695, partial [Blastocatellia bacterium]|nr:hypothetical protein [Blastocatellia bacterium]
LKSKLEDMDARMAEMRAFRLRLAAYLEECEEALADGRRDRCPALFDISLSSVHEANPSSRLFTSAKKTSRKKRRKKDER